MQGASPAAPKRRLRWRARLLVQGINAAPATEQTETGFDAGQVAPRLQADHQSAVIVEPLHLRKPTWSGSSAIRFSFGLGPGATANYTTSRDKIPAYLQGKALA